MVSRGTNTSVRGCTADFAGEAFTELVGVPRGDMPAAVVGAKGFDSWFIGTFAAALEHRK